MAIPNSGTFEYVAIVPDRQDGHDFECQCVMREPVVRWHTWSSESRLVGVAPIMKVTDAGVTPNANARRPLVLRSRITLTASERDRSSVAEAAFHVDKALISCVRPGDHIHLDRTACGGLGLSVISDDGTLIAAAGAIAGMPLGREVRASFPRDLVESAQAVFRSRDPSFELSDLPLEVTIKDSRTILSRGRRKIGDYVLVVMHGFFQGEPGTDGCAAISRKRAVPDLAAEMTAMLLDDPEALSIARWA